MLDARTVAGRFLQSTAHELCAAVADRDAAERDAVIEHFARTTGLNSDDILARVVFEKVRLAEGLGVIAGDLPSFEQVRRASAELKWAILAGCVSLLNAAAEADVEPPSIRPC